MVEQKLTQQETALFLNPHFNPFSNSQQISDNVKCKKLFKLNKNRFMISVKLKKESIEPLGEKETKTIFF